MDTLRLLVVDDEPGMRHSIRRSLRHYTLHLPDIESEVRFELSEAESGEQALERIAAERYDLVLLDHKLGGMTGVDVLEALRQRELDALIVMITAFATIETAVRATKSGAFDFLAKPFTPEELKETVRKAAAHLVVQRQARRLAEEKKRVRFEFIRVLGHELKAPLGAIEAYVQLMRDRIAGDRLDAYDEILGRCALRAEGMRKLIADLLDLTRIESGEKLRSLGPVDVAEAARAALDAVRPRAAPRQIALELKTAGRVELTADRGEIDIILNNLVSNAVKYNHEGGQVVVEIVGDEDALRIAVRDTGIGLTPAEAARLFRDFARIRNEKTRDIPGSGLGLSIVRKIADLYRGDVHVKSAPDAGSTFTVVLRRAGGLEPAREPQRMDKLASHV